MRQVKIRELKSKLSQNLKNLPFQIVDGKTGRVVAVVKESVLSDIPIKKIETERVYRASATNSGGSKLAVESNVPIEIVSDIDDEIESLKKDAFKTIRS